jgi:hypothetical protein
VAITATVLTSGGDSTDGTSFSTASVTPAANSLVLISFYLTSSSTTSAPTSVVGNGITYTQLETNTPASRTMLLYAGMSASPTAGPITITLPATHTSLQWTVMQFTGADTTGTNGSGAIVQSQQSKPATATSINVALASAPTAGNAVYAALGISANAGTYTPGSGWTQAGTTSIIASPTVTYIAQYDVTTPLATAVTGSWTTTGTQALVACEIKASSIVTNTSALAASGAASASVGGAGNQSGALSAAASADVSIVPPALLTADLTTTVSASSSLAGSNTGTGVLSGTTSASVSDAGTATRTAVLAAVSSAGASVSVSVTRSGVLASTASAGPSITGFLTGSRALTGTASAGTAIIRGPMTAALTAGASTGASVGGTVTPPPPVVPTRGLQIYLEANSLGLADGTAVDIWPDKTANGNNATQTTVAARPIYRAAGLNGQPSVQFDGVDDNFDLVASAGAIFQNANEGTIVLVATDTNITDTAAHQVVFFSRNTTATRFAVVHSAANQYQIAARRLDADAAANLFGVQVAAGPVLEVSVANWAAGTGQHYLNGTLDIDAPFTSAGATSNTAGTNNQIGMQGNGTNFFPGHIALIAVYNVVLTPVERLQLGRYVQNTYGITVAGTGPTDSFTATASASAGVGTADITHSSVFASTASSQATDSGLRTTSPALTATASAAPGVAAGPITRTGTLLAQAVSTPAWVGGSSGNLAVTAAAGAVVATTQLTRTGTLTATGVMSASDGGVIQVIKALASTASASAQTVAITPMLAMNGGATSTIIGFKGASVPQIATASAVPAFGGVLIISRGLTGVASATMVFTPVLVHSYAWLASAVATVTNAGFFTHQLKGQVAPFLGLTGTLAPLRERFSTVLVTADVTGDPHSITGMQASASVAVDGAQSILSLGPPARFNIDVDVTGRFSIITQFQETVAPEFTVTGRLRVVQSLTTVMEEGLPALLTAPVLPDPVLESQPEPEPEPMHVPVYTRTFLGLRP